MQSKLKRSFLDYSQTNEMALNIFLAGYSLVVGACFILLQVIDFKIPSELNEQIDFKVGENGVDAKDILSICDKVLSLSVHTCELITGDCIIKCA